MQHQEDSEGRPGGPGKGKRAKENPFFWFIIKAAARQNLQATSNIHRAAKGLPQNRLRNPSGSCVHSMKTNYLSACFHLHGKSLIICCENSPCKKWLSIVGREKRQKDNSIIYLISYCIVSKNVSRLFLAKERIKTGHSFMVLERLWKTSSTFYGLPYFFWLPDFLGFYASSPLLVDVV